ncbi:MAG TPA: type II secretion system F family protein [Firmicutes bacterium]|nr:type II secretion system F family protein [Bacillota bacterium]
MFFLIPALVFISVSLAVFAGYRLWHQQQTVKERIGQYKEEPDEEQDHQAAAGSSQLKRGLTRLAALLTVKEKGPGYQKLRRQLLLAGEPGKLKPQEFIVLKLTISALTFVLGIILPVSLTNVVVLVAVSWLLPDLYLQQKIRKRQLAITLAIPDVLDLLTVSVEAGLGFDAAVARVIEKAEGPLAEELRRMLYEMRIGKPRRDALRNLSERTGVGYLHNFVTAVIQADQLGVSISKVLRIQSQDIRRQRRQKAEEEAMKAPIKMLLPLVGLIFPSLFIILLGPSILHFMATF